MKLRRLIQLLNFKRTAQLEQEAAQFKSNTLDLLAANRRLLGATEELVAEFLAKPVSGQHAIDTALQIATRGSLQSNLIEIQRLMACGQIRDAKMMLDALILVTRAEAS